MTHRIGTFCFAELATPLEANATEFYGDLFGWTTLDVLSTSGSYALFEKDGKTVAGLRHRAAGPPRWIPYVMVEQLEDTLRRAQELGARVSDEPFEIPGMARMATLDDPEGRTFGLYQADGVDGVELKEAPGSIWWVEMLARDVPAARKFYIELFGWELTETQLPHLNNPYTVFKTAGASAAGAVQIQRDWGSVAQRWQVLFAIADYDATLAHVAAVGGSADVPIDIPHLGRLAQVTDDSGGLFLVMQARR